MADARNLSSSASNTSRAAAQPVGPSPLLGTVAPRATDPRPSRVQALRALRHRDFRLLWSSMIVSSIGTWMQIVAQSLLVLALTHSAIALGVVSLAQALSFFCFSFIGGSVADRVDKRRFLLLTQSVQVVLAALLGVLTLTGVVQIWMIVVLAFGSGAVLSFDQPARSSLVPLLVPRAELLHALALQSVVFTGAALIGPGLAALAIGPFGFAGAFFLNALSYGAVLAALALIRMPTQAAEARETRGTIWSNVGEALRQVRQDAALPWLVTNYGAMFFFGPSSSLILPIFATRILHVGTGGLGLLFMASGAGTILGAAILASLSQVRHKGTLALGATLVWTAALIIFAFSRSFALTTAALVVFGAAQNMCAATTITLMQTRVPPRMRGRVMSLNTLLMMGVRPLGDFPVAALLGIFTPALVVAVSAGIVGAYSLGITLTRPQVRDVE